MKVAIISGSVYGTAEEVARHAELLLKAAGHEAWHAARATLQDVEGFAPEALLAVTSTTGMGELPDNLMPLYSMIRDTLPAAWRGLPGAVIGYLIVMTLLFVLLVWEYLRIRSSLNKQDRAPRSRERVSVAQEEPSHEDALMQTAYVPRRAL